MFTTHAPPILATDAASSLPAASVALNGDVTARGGGTPSSIGFICGKDKGLMSSTDAPAGGTSSPFTVEVANLTSATHDWAAADETNSSGTGFGDTRAFPASAGATAGLPCAISGTYQGDDFLPFKPLTGVGLRVTCNRPTEVP